MHEDYVPQAHMEVLNSRWYREVDPDTYRDELVTKQYRNLCAVVERVMDVGDGVAETCSARVCVWVPLRLLLWISLPSLTKVLVM